MSTALPPKSYDDIETEITAYIQTLTMEPDPQLQAVTANKLRRFLKKFHSAGWDVKMWVYHLFNTNQAVTEANNELNKIWKQYQADSIALKEARGQQASGPLIPLSQEPGEPSRGRPRARGITFSRPMGPTPSQGSSGSGSGRPMGPTPSHHSSGSGSVVSRASTASLFQFEYGSDFLDPRAAPAHGSRGNIPAQMIPYSQGQPGYPGQGYAGYAQPGQSAPAYSYSPGYSVSSHPGGAYVPQASPSAPMNYRYAQAPGQQPGSQGSYPTGYGSGFYQGSYPSSSR
ncbi:hypothetical protein B0H14DRAFT_2755591 [Mycena olivaceomarginata]|nr:hypothetical protein B0H14DRAFT_2755591 [Mycena olivaceomarginata]